MTPLDDLFEQLEDIWVENPAGVEVDDVEQMLARREDALLRIERFDLESLAPDLRARFSLKLGRILERDRKLLEVLREKLELFQSLVSQSTHGRRGVRGYRSAVPVVGDRLPFGVA